MSESKTKRQSRIRAPRQRFSDETKLKAVRLYLEEGYSGELIRQKLGVGPSALTAWARRYREQGEDRLRSQRPGRGTAARAGRLPARGRTGGGRRAPIQIRFWRGD